MSHLLTLADLHAAAPGVLDVVFGADGDFPGAPSWAGPMTGMARYPRHSWLVWRGLFHASVGTDDGLWSCTVDEWRERWALDCRVPSVAARLIRLCSFVESVDPNLEPYEVAALTLALAPQIAALGAHRVA